MRLLLLVTGFLVGLTVALLGVVAESVTLVAVGVLLAVPIGVAMKPEAGKEPYARAVSRTKQVTSSLGERLRLRYPMALLGGFGGFIIGGLTMGWWRDLGLPVQCQDLFFPDPSLCDVLSSIRSWFVQSFVLVGMFLGWISRGSDEVEPSATRALLEVVGQLVALAAVVIGADLIAPVAFDLPGYRNSPWPNLAAGSAAIGGGILYTMGLRQAPGRTSVVEKAVGWMMFTCVFLIPVFVSTYLVRWWVQGALLSVMALPVIWQWNRINLRRDAPFRSALILPH